MFTIIQYHHHHIYSHLPEFDVAFPSISPLVYQNLFDLSFHAPHPKYLRVAAEHEHQHQQQHSFALSSFETLLLIPCETRQEEEKKTSQSSDASSYAD